MTIYGISLAWMMLLVSVMSYIAIAIKLFRSRAKLMKHDANIERASTHVVIRFVFYISLLVCQWTPGSISMLMGIFNIQVSSQLTFVVVIMTNIGGWFNALAFFSSRMIRKNKVEASVMKTTKTRA